MSRPARMQERVHEIDGLRFLAIFAVLCVHYRPPFRPGLSWLGLGWAGVDLFFVISGYLITTNLLALRGTPRAFRIFYWRRALRIFPAYYLVLFALIALCHHFGNQPPAHIILSLCLYLTSLVSWPSVPHYPLPAILSVLHHGIHPNALLPLDNHVFLTFDAGIYVLWSLSIEELFYLVWAPLVLKCSRQTIAGFSLAMVVLCPIVRLVCHMPQAYEYFYFPARFDALTFGALLALAMTAMKQGKLPEATLRKTLSAACVVSAVLVFALAWHCGLFREMEIRSALSFSVFGYSLLGVLFASVLGASALRSGSSQWWTRALRFRPLTYIGEISYMIYLVHLPVFVGMIRIYTSLSGDTLVPTIPFGLLAASTSIGLAALSWRYYEKPILTRFRQVVR